MLFLMLGGNTIFLWLVAAMAFLGPLLASYLIHLDPPKNFGHKHHRPTLVVLVVDEYP